MSSGQKQGSGTVSNIGHSLQANPCEPKGYGPNDDFAKYQNFREGKHYYWTFRCILHQEFPVVRMSVEN